MWTTAGPTNPAMALIFTLAFVNSIRGAFAYRRLVRKISSPRAQCGTAHKSESASAAVPTATIDPPDIATPDQPKRRAVLVSALSVGALSILVIALVGHFSKWSFLPFGMRGEGESIETTIETLANDGYRKLLQLAETRKGKHLHAVWRVSSDGTYNLDVDLYQTDAGAVLVMFWHNEFVATDSQDDLQKSARSPDRKIVLRDSDRDNNPDYFKEYSEPEVTQHVPFAVESLVSLDGNDAQGQMGVLWAFGIQILVDDYFPLSKYTSKSMSGI